MIGRGFSFFGMRGASRVMANDDAGGAPPPLPIVDDTAAMMRDLEKERGRVARIGGTYCLILIRLDDSQESELVPQIVDGIGKRFAVGLRPYDSIYRFGPEMYLIGVSHIKVEDTMAVMERLRTVVSGRLLTMQDGRVMPATVSLGGTMMDSGASVEENLDRAGRALYAAVQDGGDAVRIWSSDLNAA
ncbi:MAG: diguanylate cyclase [Rhodospirillales bacterium]|nr:MAG: diguanylate cyclase [Rhodospirillales bacterium]